MNQLDSCASMDDEPSDGSDSIRDGVCTVGSFDFTSDYLPIGPTTAVECDAIPWQGDIGFAFLARPFMLQRYLKLKNKKAFTYLRRYYSRRSQDFGGKEEAKSTDHIDLLHSSSIPNAGTDSTSKSNITPCQPTKNATGKFESRKRKRI